MQLVHSSPRFRRPFWCLIAFAYSLVGLTCLLVLPIDEGVMVTTIAGGLPWSLALATLNLTPGVAIIGMLILIAGWLVNASILWWLALRPMKRSRR